MKKMQIKNVELVRISSETAKDAAKWCGGRLIEEIDALDHSKKFPAINVPTADGVVRGSEGDYVAKHGGGFGVITHAEYELMFGSDEG